MDTKEYGRLVKRRSARSPILKNTISAFLVGGAICLLGEAIGKTAELMGAEEKSAALITTVALVLTSAILTGVGVYDSIARVAGAGTLVPVTGFANAVASPAIDTKSEGWVLGVGAKIFGVAGPVILYGTAAGALYGVVTYLLSLLP